MVLIQLVANTTSQLPYGVRVVPSSGSAVGGCSGGGQHCGEVTGVVFPPPQLGLTLPTQGCLQISLLMRLWPL